MDKAEFIREAPIYYALAIGNVIGRENHLVSKHDIRSQYLVVNEYDPNGHSLIENEQLWERAIDWLVEQKLVRVLRASFGPSMFEQTANFGQRWTELVKINRAFQMYREIGHDANWLEEALRDVARTAAALNISDQDFDELTIDEWAPIPLEFNETTQKAVDALDEAAKKISQDNGYAANFPEEREFVIDGIDRTVEKIKSGSITVGHIRDVWTKLNLVYDRFKGAALEIVVVGAKQALTDLVKQHGGDLLRALWRMLSS